jgi:hypothetical protein
MILAPRHLRGYAMVFAALSCAASIRAQVLEPHEKEMDPPAALVWRTEFSPARVSQHGAFISYQVNVTSEAQNISGDAANEPSITIDPADSIRMAIGWRQFPSVTSNFRMAGWAYTTNGGTSWTFPGVLTNQFRSDPVLSSDVSGKFFYNSLIANFYTDMWRSDTSGMSWIYLGPSHGGDKQWFTIDTTSTASRGFQYQSWSTAGNNYNGAQFSRSVDGGANWSYPSYIPNQPCWGTLDVDSFGNLFIGGVNFSDYRFYCVRSTDAKDPNVAPTFDRSTIVDLGGRIQASQSINPVGLVGQVYLAVDRSGTATHNNIYMLASVLPNTASGGTDVMFARSTDGGLSFTPPVRINNDPPNPQKWHWFGTMAVAPNGRIDVIWYDTRNAANNTDSQLFYAYSFDGGGTWSPNIAVSQPFNPFVGYPNQNKLGDYIGLVSDNAAGHVAYAATFNGEQDVYYVRVAPVAPVPLSAVSRKTHGSAGAFDVPLPLSGKAAVESRRGPTANAGQHQVVVTFGNNVSVGGVSVTSADGLASATHSISGAVVTLNLSNVRDAQTLSIKLTNVNDGTGLGDVIIPMAVLIGDSSNDAVVNSGDAIQTRNRAGQAIDATNFRSDINADAAINSGDAVVVRSRSGTTLP